MNGQNATPTDLQDLINYLKRRFKPICKIKIEGPRADVEDFKRRMAASVETSDEINK